LTAIAGKVTRCHGLFDCAVALSEKLLFRQNYREKYVHASTAL